MRVCKVITTVFAGRTIREHTTELGVPRGFFNHSQNFPTPDSVIDLLKLTISIEKNVDPGVETDVVIVNNDVNYEKGNAFLNLINDEKIHSGKIRILHRENYGRSFGGYNYAFEKFKNEYDYFIFTEDDILINGDGYAKKAIDVFESEESVGAVAYQSTSTQNSDGRIGQEFIHIHGGVCLSSARMLGELYDKCGMLPHCTKNESQRYDDILEKGEVAFTNKIYKIGYKLININEKLYEYAYDQMRGIKI